MDIFANSSIFVVRMGSGYAPGYDITGSYI